jgi:hypothetical protein
MTDPLALRGYCHGDGESPSWEEPAFEPVSSDTTPPESSSSPTRSPASPPWAVVLMLKTTAR